MNLTPIPVSMFAVFITAVVAMTPEPGAGAADAGTAEGEAVAPTGAGELVHPATAASSMTRNAAPRKRNPTGFMLFSGDAAMI